MTRAAGPPPMRASRHTKASERGIMLLDFCPAKNEVQTADNKNGGTH